MIAGQTLATYKTGVLSTTSVYSVEVTDSSTGTPSSISSTCTSVTVTVGHGPEGLASDPVTGTVYVVDPLSNHVSVIDSDSNTVVTNVTVGTLPWGIAVDTVNNLIYVTDYGSGTVSVVDGLTNALCVSPRCAANTIIVGSAPKGIGFNGALHEVYVANSGSNTVSVINTTSDSVIYTVPVGNSPQSIAVGPSPSAPPYNSIYDVFVTNYGSNTISVIALASPPMSYQVTTVTVGNNPWGVTVNPSTDLVYVTNSGSGTVSVLNGTTYATVATITLGAGSTPEGIAVVAAGTLTPTSPAYAYVANAATNTVSVINLATYAVTPVIPVGGGPFGVTTLISPVDLTYPYLAYVSNTSSNLVSVINLATNQVLATIIVS